jgi:endogenous inhibitor of DNA gyrase (YacG/DUF329 family)
MPGFLDNQTITIPCPACGHQHRKTIGWIKANDHIPCVCNRRIDLNKSQFVSELAKVDRSVDDLRRTLRDL